MKTVINVIEDDILSLTGYDAIVNSTNAQLKPRIGDIRDRKIHKLAGKELEEECEKVRATGGCEMCGAVTTGAYQLPYHHIIHVVVPDAKKDGASWWEYGQCFFSVLSAAMDSGDKKIALPLLGIKKHNYSEKEAAEYAVKRVQEFCKAYPDCLEQITFVIGDNPELAEYMRNLILDIERGTQEIVSLMLDINRINLEELKKISSEILSGVEEAGFKTFLNALNRFKCISVLTYLPLMKLILKALKFLHIKTIDEVLVLEKDRAVLKFLLYNQEIVICIRQIAIRKQENRMNIVIDIDKINLDTLMDSIVDCKYFALPVRDNRLKNYFFKSVNMSLEGNKKYELVQYLFAWVNSTNLINNVIHNMAEQVGEELKQRIVAMELEVGDIKLLI